MGENIIIPLKFGFQFVQSFCFCPKCNYDAAAASSSGSSFKNLGEYDAHHHHHHQKRTEQNFQTVNQPTNQKMVQMIKSKKNPIHVPMFFSSFFLFYGWFCCKPQQIKKNLEQTHTHTHPASSMIISCLCIYIYRCHTITICIKL